MRSDLTAGRFRRFNMFMAIALSTTFIASCSSNSIAPPAVTGTRTYMQADPSAVIWLDLNLGQRVSGTSQEFVGPGLTKDRKTHHYTDRIVGTLSGDTLTFTMVRSAPGDPWGGSSGNSTISNRRIVMKGLTGDVFTASTQQQFQAAVAVRAPLWAQQQVEYVKQCQTMPAACGSG